MDPRVCVCLLLWTLVCELLCRWESLFNRHYRPLRAPCPILSTVWFELEVPGARGGRERRWSSLYQGWGGFGHASETKEARPWRDSPDRPGWDCEHLKENERGETSFDLSRTASQKADDQTEISIRMAPKRKGGKNQQANTQSPQTAPSNQSAPANLVTTPAQGRPAPRDRSAQPNDASLTPGTTNMVAGSASSVQLLDVEMDRLAVEIEAAERTQKDLAEQLEASVASARTKRERLRLLLDASPVVAQGVTLTGTLAPAQSASARTPDSAESTRSPAEVEAIRRSMDTVAVDKERQKRLGQALSMPLPIDPLSDVTTVEPPSRKKSRPQVVHPWETPANTASYWSVMSADLAVRSPGAFDNEVEFTGRSQTLPSPAELQLLTASYVRNHVKFAEISPEYDAMPAVPGAQAAAAALIANLRVAVQNPRPAPSTIAWIIRHLAAAAPSLIVGISGGLVGHLLHTMPAPPMSRSPALWRLEIGSTTRLYSAWSAVNVLSIWPKQARTRRLSCAGASARSWLTRTSARWSSRSLRRPLQQLMPPTRSPSRTLCILRQASDSIHLRQSHRWLGCRTRRTRSASAAGSDTRETLTTTWLCRPACCAAKAPFRGRLAIVQTNAKHSPLNATNGSSRRSQCSERVSVRPLPHACPSGVLFFAVPPSVTRLLGCPVELNEAG